MLSLVLDIVHGILKCSAGNCVHHSILLRKTASKKQSCVQRKFTTTNSYQKRFATKLVQINKKHVEFVPPTTGKLSEKLKAMGFDTSQYTLETPYIPKDGGRDWRGRRVTRRAGGARTYFRMVDYTRTVNEDGSTRVMQVVTVDPDPMYRGPHLAMVKWGEERRRIIATKSMRPGQYVRNHAYEEDKVVVDPVEGDCYPVGMLPDRTVVSCVSIFPGAPQNYVIASGSKAILQKKEGHQAFIRLSSKLPISIDARCRVVVGQISNEEWSEMDWGKAGFTRWQGIRPHSGLFQKKDGRFGRKIHPPKKVKEYLARDKRPATTEPVY